MQRQEINNFYDLTPDFLWGLQHRWNPEFLKKFIREISNDFSFEVDWDEGIENWIALHGKNEHDFILLSCQIPFAFVNKKLCNQFKKYTYIRTLFFKDYTVDKIYLPKEIMRICFNIPKEYLDEEIKSISDFIYETYT